MNRTKESATVRSVYQGYVFYCYIQRETGSSFGMTNVPLELRERVKWQVKEIAQIGGLE